MMMRRGSVFWGAVLTAVGLLLLLRETGVLRIDLWGLVWPLLLIGLGGWLLLIAARSGSPPETEQLRLPLDGCERGRLVLRHGGGRVRIAGGAEPGQALSGSFVGGVAHQLHCSEGLLEVRLGIPQSAPFGALAPWLSGAHRGPHWDLALSDELEWELDVESGASKLMLDLQELRVRTLKVGTGASSTEVTLPARGGHTRARIEGGAASVAARIPEGAAARIRAQGGLASIHVDRARFPLRGDAYVSPDYDRAEHRIDLTVELGVGSADVR